MAVEEQNFETAAASNGALERGADALADGLQGEVARPFAGKEHDSASGHAANGDAGGGVFGELDDLEAVDMTGGTLKHMPETHVHARGDEGTLDSLAMNPDLLADSSHLSASATPDKAREIEVISERIAILHEHLQKSNMDDGNEEMVGRIKQCRSVEDISIVLLLVVKQGFDCHPTFSLWSHQDRTDWERRCSDCSSVEAMSELVADLERQVGVQSACDEEENIGGSGGGHEAVEADCDAEALPEEAAVEEQAPATTSRYGRARAVPNFARMVDPLAQRASTDAPAPRAPPSNGGADDVQATATQHMIELVRVIVSKAPKPGAALPSPAAGAPGQPAPAQPASTGQDKYVGVRIKQNGYGAVIKKNHSEINLGTFQTPEEAARAYDMAALMCQGDRAKVNFLDSWDIVQQYDTTAIREPFRDHHRETREHTAGMQSARQHSFGQGVDFTPLTYESADTSKPTALGRLLNSFADRFPYAAVRDLDPAVWDVFTERNSTLSAFSEFGSQLLWLSSQVTDAAMKDSWGLHQGAFERDCRNTDQGGKCVEALKLYDHQGVDWDKVQSLWEIDDDGGGDSMSKRGGMKRKRAGDGEGREKIEDFLHFNWHILSEFERDGTKAMPVGIEPTLNLMRSHRQVPKPAAEEKPKKLPQPVHVPKPEVAVRRPVLNTAVAKPANPKPVLDRNRAGRDREREKEASAGCSSKNKGMQCRFCGKVFTHAPAHLQHERAHLQQQETKNPSSRIFQHMPGAPIPTSSKPLVRNGRSGALDLCDDGTTLQSGSLTTPQLSKAVKMEQDECLVDPVMDSLDELEPRLANPDDDGDEEQGVEEEEDNVAEGDLDDEVDDEEEPGSKRAKVEFDAGAMDATCDSQSCVDQGVPCPPCAKQNKGIAACFAQGHLYLTLKGEVPSSCKDCKARNKGALFCFKRGHMVNMRAMLNGGAANGMCSTVEHLDADAIDDQSEVDQADDEDGKMGDENDFAEADDVEVDGEEDVSGPVSPAEGQNESL